MDQSLGKVIRAEKEMINLITRKSHKGIPLNLELIPPPKGEQFSQFVFPIAGRMRARKKAKEEHIDEHIPFGGLMEKDHEHNCKAPAQCSDKIDTVFAPHMDDVSPEHSVSMVREIIPEHTAKEVAYIMPDLSPPTRPEDFFVDKVKIFRNIPKGYPLTEKKKFLFQLIPLGMESQRRDRLVKNQHYLHTDHEYIGMLCRADLGQPFSAVVHAYNTAVFGFSLKCTHRVLQWVLCKYGFGYMASTGPHIFVMPWDLGLLQTFTKELKEKEQKSKK